MSRVSLALAVGLAVAAAPATALAAAPAPAPVAAPAGAPFPPGGLAFATASGERYAMTTAPGRIRLVSFWATWCPSCRVELPSLVELGAELAPAGGELLLVSVDRTPAKAARHLESLEYRGEAAYDPGARTATAAGITGIPTTLLLDAAGVERGRVVGSGPESLERIRAAARSLLAAEVD
jgi:thiol-disulfide isomerase/thioredoxin